MLLLHTGTADTDGVKDFILQSNENLQPISPRRESKNSPRAHISSFCSVSLTWTLKSSNSHHMETFKPV